MMHVFNTIEEKEKPEIIELNEETAKDIINKWYADAKTQTFETLPEFIRHVMNDYIHDYGTVVHAIGASCVATAYACNGMPQGGITGFQASGIMWDFVRHWMYESNKCGMRLLNYDDMLYPQYADKFDKVISADTFKALQEEAQDRLEKMDNVHPSIVGHWTSIVGGQPPFGYKVKDT